MTPAEAKYKHEHYIEGETFEAFKLVNRDLREALIKHPNEAKVSLLSIPSAYNFTDNQRQVLFDRLKLEWEKDGWYCYTYYGHIFEIKSQPSKKSLAEKISKFFDDLLERISL